MEDSKNFGLAPQRLFVIGNGFDIMHRLKTTYDHFRAYLTQQVQCSRNTSLSRASAFFIDFFDKHCRGTNWSDIEGELINIVFDIDDFVSQQTKGNHKNIVTDDCLLRMYFEFYNYMCDFLELFDSWIKTIEIENVRINLAFRSLAENEASAFLNFNYTPVLEKIYNIKNICYIHGKIGDKIVFGHGGNLTPSVEYWLMDYIYGGLYRPFMRLKKEPEKYIMKNKEFFNQTTYWREIYSHGFSFSKVDMPYVFEICQKTDNSSIWYLSDYESTDVREAFKQTIRECGFRGNFDVFHIT